MPPWQPKTPPLTTPWTAQVALDNALPEYPRPQLTRERWQNLNGLWQFAVAHAGQRPPFGEELPERILVPYPVESALSGIMRHEDRMWYRRGFTVPTDWHAGSVHRVLLHFGAVDFEATVYVNERQVAHHRGGYDAFTADITEALADGGRGPQELVVGVFDPTDAGGQPIGKQRREPDGIWYTPNSGIWQTVWMEPVAPAHIDALDMTPDLATQSLLLTPRTTGAAGHTVVASAYAGGRQIAAATGPANSTLRVPVPEPRLWSPDDPHLYTLTVELQTGHQTVDAVGSYFGMRSVTIAKDADDAPRLMLNGEPIFAMAPLDQGYWPDGVYTPPTDAALRFDLERAKELGFNSVRKHVKVEPARWYYWADTLGLLVWQDMPAMKISQPDPEAQAEFLCELRAMIDQHRSVTSIVAWVPFNEGWGEFAPGAVADQVKQWDPTRLVDADSGVNCCYSLPDAGEGDVYDDHTYVGPGTPPEQAHRIAIVGEYGGLGLEVDGHMWPGNAEAYEMTPDSETLTNRYVQLQHRLLEVESVCGLSAAVYTQTTDVETEVNGLWTYDRMACKVDSALVRAANLAVQQRGAVELR